MKKIIFGSANYEAELAALWLTEWKLTEEILIAAYDECVNQKSKFNMSYTAKILENWHKDGVKTVADIMGHKNASITLNRYAHCMLDHKIEMMQKLPRIF